MALTSEQQDLVDFFSGRELPVGPQHINEYSVLINLPEAVQTQLHHLNSDVETSCQSAMGLLREVKDWLEKQAVAMLKGAEAA